MGKKAAGFLIDLDGNIVGPVSSSRLRELAVAGKITPETKIALSRETGDLNWVAAKRVKGLFDKASTPTPAAPAQSARKIVVACQCGKRFQAPSHLAGRQVKCPGCQQPIQIPPAVTPPTTSPAATTGNGFWDISDSTEFQEEIIAAREKGEEEEAVRARIESGEPGELSEIDALLKSAGVSHLAESQQADAHAQLMLYKDTSVESKGVSIWIDIIAALASSLIGVLCCGICFFVPPYYRGIRLMMEGETGRALVYFIVGTVGGFIWTAIFFLFFWGALAVQLGL